MGNFLNTQCFIRIPSILIQKKGYTSSAIYIPTAGDIHSRKKIKYKETEFERVI